MKTKPFLLASSLILAGLNSALVPALASGNDQLAFNSPDDVVSALVTAEKDHDTNTIHAIFGPAGMALMSPDPVQAGAEHQMFVERLTQKTRLINDSETNATLELGNDGWPFPIPLVKQNDRWSFDTLAGKDEIFRRRIGMNELGAISVCYAYVEAQQEYASQDRDGDGVLAFAQYLHSTPGKHDGLFWPTNGESGGQLSPLGPLIAQARVEGYHHTAKIINDQSAPYHGYYFKILTREGKHAPAGKYDYIINGRMIGGFALIAWPAEWGNTGIMTFIVNQQGKVYQKNLGPKTASISSSTSTYDPDNTWTPVP
jgi:hypothetical protein